MRCLCYAECMDNGTIAPGEFFAHISTKWSCLGDSSKAEYKTSKYRTAHNNRQLPHSIIFITDCLSVEQLTSDLAAMPGAGISSLEIFPVPEMVEYQ
jgi:hypothetical protein